MAREKSMLERLLEKEEHQLTKKLTDKIWLWHGLKGTRKTSVASLFPNHINAAFEMGFSFVSTAVAEPMRQWNDFQKFVRALRDPRMREKYDTVVIDTIGLAYSACYDFVLSSNDIEDIGDLPYGKGWRQVRKEFEDAIITITQLGYGLVMLAHSKMLTDKDGDVVGATIDIDKRPYSIITGLADFILYLDKEMQGETETVMAYSQRHNYETKRRCRYLADKFEFTYENLVLEVGLAVDTQNLKEGTEIVDEVVNPHQVAEVNLTELQENVIELITPLIAEDSLVIDKVYEVVGNMFPGVKIGDTQRIHIPKLEALREKLLNIMEELKQ
jgi:hypothetical protein